MLSHNHCMKNLIFKLTLAFLVVFSANFSLAQHSKKETDSLLEKEIPRLRGSAEVEKSLLLCKKVIKDYEFLNDQKGKSEAYLVAANICMTLYRIKESFEYLELAESINKNLKSSLIEAKIHAQYGKNYDYLGYESLALESYNKGISILNTIKDKELAHFMYAARGFLYEKKRNYNAFYQDAHKAHDYYPNTQTAVRLAKYHIIYKKNLDSGKFYLNIAEHLYQTHNFPIYQKAVLKRMNGRYYFAQKEYEKAISFYKESLEIYKKINNPIEIKEDYKLLYEAYKAVGNLKKEKEYLEKYTKISDSMVLIKKRNQEIPLKKVIKENKNIEEKSKMNIYFFFSVVFFFLLIVWLLTRKKYIQKNKEKEILLTEKEEENQDLKQKVNEYFDEIVQLAKTNSPEFLTRFQEVYPNFIEKLKEISPEISSDDLRFCALLKLNFSTKDIAEYTFVTIRTVQTRKSRLRKKFNIPSDDDIYLWINKW